MLEKPGISDSSLINGLDADFGIVVSSIQFLPLGNDVNTAVYRVTTADSASYFLKLRRGHFDAATVAIPHWLACSGVDGIISPIPARTGELWSRIERWAAILYPFVRGRNGLEHPLEVHHWEALGQILYGIHTRVAPPELASEIPIETFDALGRQRLRIYQQRAEQETFTDSHASALASLIQAQKEIIDHLITRAETLARECAERSLELVLCHGDLHAFNVLIDDHDTLFVVDWDTLLLAPRERDLMFIGAGIGGVWDTEREVDQFFEGYGDVAVDPVAIAYYRYDRIVQDIAEFCEQLMDSDEGGTDRQNALELIYGLFDTGSVIDIAIWSDPGSA